MSLVTCDYCLGEGKVFNGKFEVNCPVCRGDCVIQDYDTDELPAERIFEDDRELFDENNFSSDD